SSALLGVSEPGYKKWRWHDLGAGFNGFGGPNFIQIPGGHWIGAGRMHDGGVHTALTYVDVKNGNMTRLMKLPSGRDTSYPGLVWYEGMLYVSYYSGHEGRTSIYLAKLKVEQKQVSEEGFGAEANPTGNPIGGGKGYQRLIVRSDYLAKTLEELLAALKQAKTGEVVYVNDNAEIDLTGEQKIVIPGGVTLASGRGRGGSKGALLYSEELATSPMFLTGGEKVRVAGLRLRGPDQERRTEQMRKLYKEGRYYSIPNSDGIISSYPGLEVDNCELWGWSHAAIFLKRGALKAHIHHNNIHHNQRSGLGYGVCLDQADALIEANLFDWCRHHIAGTGRPGTSYEARYNLVFESANGHSFDMHGGRDRKDGTDIAGDSIKIHHNTFKATGVPAFVIRGRPQQSADIHHNWFLHSSPDKAIRQTNATGNMNVYQNQFAKERILKD
ncbi:MAG: right-handed parallel beta-helix repeat-containing protein, partial [Planctomycetota bacterium]